jgi:hypothetical protein
MNGFFEPPDGWSQLLRPGRLILCFPVPASAGVQITLLISAGIFTMKKDRKNIMISGMPEVPKPQEEWGDVDGIF